MGEDAAETGGLNRDGVEGEQRLAAILRQTSAIDPHLLSQAIYHYAASDIDAQNIGLEAEIRKLRTPILKAMLELKAAAQQLLGTAQTIRAVSPLEYAIASLIGGSEDTYQHQKTANRYLQLLKEIAEIPLVNNLSAFSTKPELDWPTTRVVTGVLAYCYLKGISGGAPKSEQADSKYTNPVKSKASLLVVEILDSMGINYNENQIATHMHKANDIIKQLPFLAP